MKLLNKLFILTATAIAISSCQGDLLDTKPYDKASSGSMWSNENFCTMGVASIYATLREGYVAKEAYLMEAFSVGATCRDNDYPLLAGYSFHRFRNILRLLETTLCRYLPCQ